jgi:response regulator RpfG family c-di-GMP phosphodiesterase
MKDQSLRVLMIDDSEDDVLLVIRKLKTAGYNPVYEWMDNSASMKKALREKQWDIILCDYQMPNFNVPSALALLNESGANIPLIVVSGISGEDVVTECMHLGAKDYVTKGNLSRLGPAITRELEAAKIRNKCKRAENELRQIVDELKSTLQVMVTAVEAREPYKAGHQINSAKLACAIAAEMELAQETTNNVHVAASLHDIGKLSIPAEILAKPSKLTELEFALV